MNPIRRIIDLGVTVNIAFVAVIILACYAAWQVPIDRYPNLQFGEVNIRVVYPGATPAEVEQDVIDVIEDGIREMHRREDLEFVRSTATPGLANISVKWADDSDYGTLFDQLRLAVLGVQTRLPVVNGKHLTPFIANAEVDEWMPLLQVNLMPSAADRPLEKRTLVLLAEDLRTRIEQVPGVKRVIILGDAYQQFELVLDPVLLQRHRVGLQEVAAALRVGGGAPPAGVVDTRFGEVLVRVDNHYRSRDDLLGVVVRRSGDGNFLTLGQLVDPAGTGPYDADGVVIYSVDGRNAVSCKVLKKSSANAIRLAGLVREEVERFRAAHAEDPIAVSVTMDNTRQIREGLGILGLNLLLAVVLVMGLLFAFMARKGPVITAVGIGLAAIAASVVAMADGFLLHGIAIGILTLFVTYTCRAAVLTVSGIVFSFLGSVLLFYLVGYSINEIALFGLVLVTGIVVDDAIVVLENVHRHLESGEEFLTAVVDGTREVMLPVLSATLTTVAAFLPMLMMTGVLGEFFSLIPISVAVVLIISYIECICVLPVHLVDLHRLFGPERHRHEEVMDGNWDPRKLPGFFGALSRVYDRVLRFCLRAPIRVLGTTIMLFLLAVGVCIYSFIIAPRVGTKPLLKSEFFPDDPTGYECYLDMPGDTTRAETDVMARRVANFLVAEGPQKIEAVTSMTGLTIDRSYRPKWGSQHAFLVADLPPKEILAYAEPAEYAEDVQARLTAAFGDQVAKLRFKIRSGGPPTGADINIRVTGAEDATVLHLTQDLLAYLLAEAAPGRPLEGVTALQHDRDRSTAIRSFHLDRRRVDRLGLSPFVVADFIAGALKGLYVGEFRRGDGDIPVVLRFSPSSLDDPERLLEAPVLCRPDGSILRLGEMGEVRSESQPASLVRHGFQRTVTITGDLKEGADIGPDYVTEAVKAWYAQYVADYPGVTVAYGGVAESTTKSYTSLFIALAVGIFLIYAILATQFRSYLQPLLIMSNIVFSFTGVVLVMTVFGLLVRFLGPSWVRSERSLFTVNSFIAIVGLTGLVINDAIVFIDFINQRRREGQSLHDALRIAGHQRMRPIIMTSLTTIVGLLPMAVGVPQFSIAWSPFATCFIAGLTMSTIMTLLVLPVLYELLDSILRGAVLAWKRVWPRSRVGNGEG